MANGRCRAHGGATPVGLASPHLKHGRYSRHLPTRLLARYEQAQRDERLLELHDEIALVDARLGELLERIDRGESSRTWTALLEAARAYQAAATDGDRAAALATLLAMVERGASDEAIWQEVRIWIDHRRRLVESERKRLIELQQTLNIERAMLLLGVAAKELRESVLKHCQHDPDLARRILADASAGIERLVSGGTRAVITTDG